MSECVHDLWLNADVSVLLQSELSTIVGASNYLAGTIYLYLTIEKKYLAGFFTEDSVSEEVFFPRLT